MKLSDAFDAVIMFTWSTWKTEPRSNRYHYASRFARELPVMFVQPWSKPGAPLCVELTEIPGVEVVHCPSAFRTVDVLKFRQLLSKRKIRFPLLWIYNSLHYELLLAAMPQAFRVFHATEDFFTPSAAWELDQQAIAESVRKQLCFIDLLIAVSDGVLASCRTKGGYSGPALIVENGCDAAFLRNAVSTQPTDSMEKRKPVAVFQGGINKRLDYGLLHDLVGMLPDWEFQFCGSDEHAGEEWRSLRTHANVKYLGVLGPTDLATLLRSSTVGLIPFVQDEWIGNSFPLKALEYVACGLPVVSVPIAALRRFATDIYFARIAVDFSTAIKSAAETRFDTASLLRRKQLAEANSYDRRFAAMVEGLLFERECVVRRAGDASLPARLTTPLQGPSVMEIAVAESLALLEGAARATWRMLPAAWRARLRRRVIGAIRRDA